MLAIRFLRIGKRNQPSFKMVVVDSKKSSTAGKFIEQVGFYNPKTKEKILNAERIKYWMSVGAKASDTIHNLLVSDKIISGDKIFKFRKSKKQEPVPAESSSEAKEVKEEVKAEIPTETPTKEQEPTTEEAPMITEEVKPQEEQKEPEKPKEEVGVKTKEEKTE